MSAAAVKNKLLTNQTPSVRSSGLPIEITAEGEENAPPTAVNDSFAASEDETVSGNVFDANLHDNVSRDSDPDGDALVVTAINGDENAIGTQIILPSGASVILNADGSLFYDPTVAFNDLSAGDKTSDSFTYTISDGNGGSATATITVYINGRHDGFFGTPANDILHGTDGNDSFHAYGGDDVISTGLGSDWADGGEGYDTVVYDTERTEFVTVMNGGSIVLGFPDLGMYATLHNIERIDFTNGDLVYDIESPNLGLVYRMYQAGFGRTPDEGGLRFWIDRVDFQDDLPGSSQQSLAAFFAQRVLASDEFKDLYGSNPSNSEYIDAMYLNVLGRLPDDAGRAFWIDGMNQGLARDQILVAFSESDENVEQTSFDIDNGVWVL